MTTRKVKKLNISQGQELDILRKVVEITQSEPDLDVVLKEVVKVVTEMTKADSTFVYLIEDKVLTLMASKTPHKKELGRVTLKAGEGITGWVAKEKKPVAISENAFADKRFKSFDVLPEDQYEAILSVPIVYKNKTIGVVNVQHKKSHEYAPATIDLILLIAKQIGGVIEHAQLYEETKIKASQFDSLIKMSKSITSEDYIDEILNLIVAVTAEMLDSKICSIMLLDNKGKELVIKATQSLSDSYKKKPNINVKGSIVGEVLSTKKPMGLYDVREEKKYQFRDVAIKENLTSMLAVPMIVKDKAIGVISIYTKSPHHFTSEETGMLQLVANQAAVAVENTSLMDEAIRAKDALETRKIVERAKGILMEMRGLNEKAAHRLIHKKAMDSCKSMKEIAESIILMEELTNK